VILLPFRLQTLRRKIHPALIPRQLGMQQECKGKESHSSKVDILFFPSPNPSREWFVDGAADL